MYFNIISYYTISILAKVFWNSFQINKNNENNINEINQLQKEKDISKKENNNDDVRYGLNDLVSITFKCLEPNVDYSIIVPKTESFVRIKEKLYNEYPVRDFEVYFIANGGKIHRFKTIQENRLKNNDKIIINKYDNI